jgi:hypothetical protein
MRGGDKDKYILELSENNDKIISLPDSLHEISPEFTGRNSSSPLEGRTYWITPKKKRRTKKRRNRPLILVEDNEGVVIDEDGDEVIEIEIVPRRRRVRPANRDIPLEITRSPILDEIEDIIINSEPVLTSEPELSLSSYDPDAELEQVLRRNSGVGEGLRTKRKYSSKYNRKMSKRHRKKSKRHRKKSKRHRKMSKRHRKMSKRIKRI